MEEKEKALIELIEEDRVAVYLYDEGTIGASTEVCHKVTAMETYNVVGEITAGEICLYEKDEHPEETEDYSEFSNIDDDDND